MAESLKEQLIQACQLADSSRVDQLLKGGADACHQVCCRE